MNVHRPSVLYLDASPQRRRRYPRSVWLPATVAELSTDPSDRHPTGTILDNPARGRTLPDSPRLLVGLDNLAALLKHKHANSLDGREWLALLPYEYSADLAVARERVLAGDIGQPRLSDIAIPIGPPSIIDCEIDYPIATSQLEALLYGVNIIERVTGEVVRSSTWLDERPPAQALLHSLSGGLSAVQRIVPADSVPTVGFEGDIVGEDGRILLRGQFAPGPVGVWSRNRPGYEFPAIPAAKHNVQAPDSVRGGPELATLLHDLLAADSDHDSLRTNAVRLVQHGQRLLEEDAP